MGKLMEWMEDKIRRLDVWDIAFVKWSMLFFTLWLAFIYAPLTAVLQGVNPWFYFGLFVLAILRPLYRGYIKKHTGLGFKVSAKITRAKPSKKAKKATKAKKKKK